MCGIDSVLFFFFTLKTAYEMRISDWSSDVCSSDLLFPARRAHRSDDVRASLRSKYENDIPLSAVGLCHGARPEEDRDPWHAHSRPRPHRDPRREEMGRGSGI